MAITVFQTAQSYLQFLWRWKLSDGKLVDQNTANIRAEICVQCHNNFGSIGGGCRSCNKIANTVNSSLIGSAHTPSDSKLKACKLCGCDNKVSVWIPNQVLLKLEDANAFPGFCWKKRIQDNQEV